MYQIQINYNESENSQRDVIVEIENNEDLEYVFEEELTFLTDESYYRIRSKNQLGFWGDWSSCDLNELNEPMNCNSVKDYVRFFYEPDPPILQFPIDIEILTRPTFTWQEEAGADQYGIQLSSVSGNNFEDGIIIDDVVSNNEYSINSYSFESAGDATLYWRVKSIANANGDDLSSDWSEQGEFEAIKPLSPILEYPLNGILINENLQFDWSDSEGAQNYQIKVSDNYSFNSNGTIIDATPDGSYLNSFEFINDVLAGNYYWKVRTKSELGIWSEYSDVGFFEIDNPPTPQLNFPLDLSSLAEIDTLEWTSLIDLSQYEIEITNQHSEEIFIYYSETTDFLISSDIINNGTHFWKVRSKNNMEMWSQWSDIWSFWVPYNFYDEGEDFIQLQNMSVSKYLISIEQYIDFLNEAYHDPLEYIVIRGQYIKGYCDEMPEEEEQIYFKTATASDIYPYNLANVRWDDNEEIFYFEGINDLIYDNHPMVFVTWCGAKAFTKHYDLDLPTSVEWHNAIYESGWSDDSLYIDENFNGEWDEQEERASYLNFYESSDPWDLPGGTTPINFYQHPSSDLKDGLGNVWEWTNDIDGSYRHCMGGSYINTIEEISIDTIRTVNNGSNSVNKDIGFRVIKRND